MSHTPCDLGNCTFCTVACDCSCHDDPFAEPVTHPSGVRWQPADYKPLSAEARANYRRFAAKPEGAPKQ